jgi:intracellular sulfur oxidation DsrE/DsrF family protein
MKTTIMRRLALLIVCPFLFCIASAQPAAEVQLTKDTLTKAQKDSIRMENLLAKAKHPWIKNAKWTGVLPVDNPTEIPDPNQSYNLLIELVSGIKDSAASKDVLGGIAEIGRLMNLHVASGIPKKNITVVAVVHGGALKGLLTNEQYKKLWGTDNPNLSLLKELMDNGVKFIACGQAMNFQDLRRDQLLPEVKISVTAQTVLSNYQLKGYVLYSGN